MYNVVEMMISKCLDYMEIKFDFRPHKCDQCTKTFDKKSDLKKHISVHTGKVLHSFFRRAGFKITYYYII